MRYFAVILLGVMLVTRVYSQNPHGTALKIDCAACHSPASWEIPRDHWRDLEPEKPKVSKNTGMTLASDSLRFNHNKATNFALTGRHAGVDCRDCHETLVFSATQTNCISCHTDIHQQTLGNDCARCHTANNWLIDNIQELHFENGFPLTGVHMAVSCNECHLSESRLRFDRIGNDCINCHREDFNGSTSPNHVNAGFSQDCLECHDISTPGWKTDKVNHDFFPLTKGHEIADCAQCHTSGSYSNTPNACFACHQPDFEGTLDPNHVNADFPTDCAQCHTTDPDWMPAKYLEHDAVHFPIYSGKHQGVWTNCSECHTDPNDYGVNSCTICHLNPETDDGHEGVVGYAYENSACLACHPTGDADGSFDHNATDFPLTGAHLIAECAACHGNGYAGTPTACAACHTQDYNESLNPNHGSLGLPTDCASCHTTDPGWAPARFEIHDQFYVLNGAHSTIANDCATCHNGDYNNTPNTCIGCHTTDFNAVTDPNHATNQFPTDCANCHNENAWVPSSFDHNAYFPFTGAHIPVADDCIACHVGGNYTNTPNTCAGCHTPDFNSTANPNHVALNLPNDCAMCHTTQPDWAPAAFPIHNDFYVLNGAHAAISNDCATCHNGDYNNTPNTCFGCHANDYNTTTDPNHVALQFSTDCTSCHSETAWVPSTFDHDGQYFPIYSGAHDGEWSQCTDCHTNPSNYAEFTCTTCHTNPETDNEHTGVGGYVYESNACLACHPTGDGDHIFDHNTTNFPLTGGHMGPDCLQCHSSGFQGTSTQCASCHHDDFLQTANPNHTNLGFSTDCATCHTTEPGWAPATFVNHNDYYVLNGAHATIANDCATCHNGDYNNTPNTCAGCHTADFNATTDPNHAAHQFPTDCTTCHTESAWAPSTFDHSAYFPFTGAHVPIADDCVACHNGDYSNTPNTCAGCHSTEYSAATNPNHTALGLPDDCVMCHTTEPGWSPATFAIHNDYYSLNGAHAAIANDCAICHNGDYNNTPNTCIGCHTQDFNSTTDPNHVTAQFSIDCTSCHSETAWVPSTFDHDGQYFPIYSGAHDGEWSQCTDCHTNPSNYAEFTCTTCHANPETDNEHTGVGGYVYESNACLACHPTGDGDHIFDHNTTNFPLTGAHLGAECLDCHSGGFEGTSTQCASCHTGDFDQAANPNHIALGFPTDCAGCHTTDPGWAPATFASHNDYYALNGAHAAIANDCATCHNGDYNNTPNTCVGCHTADFNATTDPNHAAHQFPTDCTTCHTESAWAPSTFDHGTYFPFTGAHVPIADDCVACHNGDYSNTPNTCAGCHSTDYSAATNPNHTALGLPDDCVMCHTTEPGWSPATFAIHNDYYSLNGAHAAIANDCATCHNGDYNNTPNTCIGCHTQDFNSTTDPNHVTAQFSTDCTSCHSETAWVPSTFDHDGQYFPIYSGAHDGEWSQCTDCHTNPSNYAEFTCTTCHANPETDNEHTGVGGYVYESNACLACHPTGDGDNVFDHNTTNFPLTGGHIGTDCLECHSGGFQGTPTQCSACHTNDYNQSVNPNHVALGFPTDCASCHTTDPGWAPATFAIHNDYYILNGAHAVIANDCATCHNGDYNNTPNTCFGCHTADYSATTDPNHAASQFPTDCATCHTETDWAPSNFNHDAYFPFTGAHIPIANDCAACHIGGNYSNTPNTCEGCHQPDYNSSTNPNHAALAIPTDCDMCHTTTPGWAPATFAIHNDYYVLNGAHAVIANDCATCHNGDYNNTPNTCFGCHTADYSATTDPNHAANQFPTDCATCHTETAWTPSTFNHSSVFPFTGAHIPISNDCAACHIGGNYNNTPNTCEGCHQPDYNSSTNPNHLALAIPADCDMCHTTNPGWDPATFPIHNIYWPLTGGHSAVANDCAGCHNGNYNNTPNTCAGCHLPDYNTTTNPNHAANQFPTDCEECHTSTAWVPSTFNHNAFFPFTGAHIPISNDCAACHIGGNFNNTPNTCVGCHQPDYNSSVNPNHLALAIPTDCAMCHTTSPDWTPATFPIHNNYWPFVGAHNAVANDCAACHIGGNYNNTPNTCYGCHASDYNSVNNPNHAAAGFSTDCTLCHSQNAWQPSTFDHDNMYFPIYSGKHDNEWNQCTDCHTVPNNFSLFSCIDCHEHDDPGDLADEHEDVPGYQYVSTACYACHPEGED